MLCCERSHKGESYGVLYLYVRGVVGKRDVLREHYRLPFIVHVGKQLHFLPR
jgi:hypothetical protein